MKSEEKKKKRFIQLNLISNLCRILYFISLFNVLPITLPPSINLSFMKQKVSRKKRYIFSSRYFLL